VITADTRTTDSPAPGYSAGTGGRIVHPGDFLVPLSLILWGYGLSQTQVPSFQQYGLLSSLPLVFYAGIAVLAVSAVLELRHRDFCSWRLAVHAVVLVVMLYATAPLVYPEGRYAWLYKTIGVVQYINYHGRLDDSVDIYQNWPGFFSLASWFGKVGGYSNPVDYAKWAQLAFELAALPLLYLIYEGLGLPGRQRWMALLLYSGSNWIAQDYYSPQGLGVVLSLGIMALAMRWLYRERRGKPDVGPVKGHRTWTFPADLPLSRSIAVCAVILVIFFVLSMTHQLSPYMVAIQLGALAAARLLRPRWLPVAMMAIAVGYLLPRYGFVNSHFGLLRSLGSFFSNVKSPSLAAVSTAPSERLIAHCAEALSLGMWALSLAGAWRRWRARQPVLGLTLLAFSPVLLLAIQAYGNEGILRVYLFSLPWAAALATYALIPRSRLSPAPAGAHRTRRPQRGPAADGRWWSVRVLAALLIVLGLFLPAFFGDDAYNVMSVTEVTSVTSFLEQAPPGTIYAGIENAPFQDTWNYNEFLITPIFGPAGVVGVGPVKENMAAAITNNALRDTSRRQPVYVVITPSMINFDRDYDQVPVSAFATLEQEFARSPLWVTVMHQGGAYIFELPPEVLPVTIDPHVKQSVHH
jgi:hypothetical protein